MPIEDDVDALYGIHLDSDVDMEMDSENNEEDD